MATLLSCFHSSLPPGTHTYTCGISFSSYTDTSPIRHPTHMISFYLLFSAESHIQLFCDSMDYSLPAFSNHGISQARILQWVTISFSKVSSQSRHQTCVPCIGRPLLYHWATREAPLDLNYFFKCTIVLQPTPVSLPREPLWTEKLGSLQSIGSWRIRSSKAT